MLRQAAQSRLTIPLYGDVSQQGKPKNTEVRMVLSAVDRACVASACPC